MLPKNDLPMYELTLPIANKKIKYRPFVVKEEKNLLIAMQDSNPDTAIGMIQNVVAACTFDKVNDFDKFSQIDMEYLFINIRNKSMGEGVEITATCTKCDKKTAMTIDLSEVKVVKTTEKINPDVKISEDTWIRFHYPSLKTTYALSDSSTDDDILKVVASCMDNVVKGKEAFDTKDSTIEEIVAWLGELTKPQFAKINEYFDNAPKLIYENDYDCIHCGEKNHIHMEGLETFFV